MNSNTKRCSYVLDQEALDMLDAIAHTRNRNAMFSKRASSKSYIVRDAIRHMFEFEVKGESLIHPNDIRFTGR